MKSVPLSQKHLKQVLFLACLVLLVSGCSRDEPQPETPAKTAAPPPAGDPDVLPDTLKIKRGETTYVITGIGLKAETKVAIINNKVVKPGEEIDTGVVLEDVQPTYAIIRVGNTKHLLRPEDIQREMDGKKQ